MIYPYKVHDGDDEDAVCMNMNTCSHPSTILPGGVRGCDVFHITCLQKTVTSLRPTLFMHYTGTDTDSISFVFADIIYIAFKIMTNIYVHMLMLLLSKENIKIIEILVLMSF
jgi:hypothetical protein